MIDERDFWKRISAGDAEGFDAWYRETAPRLRLFLHHLLANPQAVEDVMQETYIHIWRRPQGFNPDRGSLRAWLYGIAHKQAAEWWRKQRPASSIEFEEAAPSRAESSSVMADLLRQLPREQRSLLWLREVEGHSYAELAGVLDIPIGTVRSRLFAAREALRVLWHSAPQGVPHDLH